MKVSEKTWEVKNTHIKYLHKLVEPKLLLLLKNSVKLMCLLNMCMCL